MRFRVGDIDVDAYVGPHKRHVVFGAKVRSPVPKGERVPYRVSQEREHEVPSPEIFPADLYTELIATQALEVEEALATAFFDRDTAARGEVLGKAALKQALFTGALDFVAGVLGLHLHHLLVAMPIDEQCFAYRKPGDPYACSMTVNAS